MPERKNRASLSLNSSEIEELLSSRHGGDLVADTIRLRLRYLQRNSYPSDKPGRGVLSAFDLQDILKLAIAFELLDAGAQPNRAMATVNTTWPSFVRAAIAGWRARRSSNAEHTTKVTDELRRFALVYPHALNEGMGTMFVTFVRPTVLARMATSREGELRGALPIDMLAVVSWLDEAFAKDPFGYNLAKIDKAFCDLASETYDTTDQGEWLPPQ